MKRREWFGCAVMLVALMALPAFGTWHGQTCPVESMFGQDISDPMTDLRTWFSDELIDVLVADPGVPLTYADATIPVDDFAVPGPIGELLWWGTELDAMGTLGGTITPGVRGPDVFTITIYENDTTSYADPMPGAVVCEYPNLPVTKVDTGVRALNPDTFQFNLVLYEYSVELPTPCSLTEGWIMIRGALGGSAGSGALFVALSSSAGNEEMREYDGVNLPYRVRTGGRRDMAFCLIESEELVEVPDVTGMDLADAETALLAEGFAVNVTYDYSGLYPAGEVISQNPVGGAEVGPGATVTLVVAADPVLVPNVVGLAQAAAASALTSAGLAVGAVSQAYNDTVPEGHVISQNPVAGASVAPGASVNLVVSRGPQVVMPAAGMAALAFLTATLAGAGLVVMRRRRK